MFGYSFLFRSRWSALIWAAGILWLAIEIAGPNNVPSSTNSSYRMSAE